MRDILERLEAKVDKIDGKVDSITTKVTKLEVHAEKTQEELEDHISTAKDVEKRVSTLESKDTFKSGALWSISGILTLLVVPLAIAWAKSKI